MTSLCLWQAKAPWGGGFSIISRVAGVAAMSLLYNFMPEPERTQPKAGDIDQVGDAKTSNSLHLSHLK